MNNKIEADVLKIVSNEAKLKINKKEILNYRWDSLQHIKIIIAIEKKFKVKISTSDIGKLNDLKSLVVYLKKIKK